jgi:iron complex outermembrane recepter protein
MHIPNKALITSVMLLPIVINTNNLQAEFNQPVLLEEVMVTAQKREKDLQKVPIAVSVLSRKELERLGITSLDVLADGAISSLRVSPSGNNKGSLSLSIREGGTADVQPTTGHTVAVYQDGIFLGRVQGLNNELVDLERIEVLRGPQGTLFGRNTTSGAVNIISKKPSGKFELEQTISTGNYDFSRYITRLNTNEFAGIHIKLDYIHSEIDGWVENLAESQADYNESKKSGARLAVNWQASENISIDYVFDQSEIKAAQGYYQLYEDSVGVIGEERDRRSKTRFELALDPNVVDIEGHAVTSTFTISDALTVKSLTSYRSLAEDGSTNYGGTFYYRGLILDENVEQEQFTQEIQFVGSSVNGIEWVAGLFYFSENTDFDITSLISLTPAFDPMFPPLSVAPVMSTIGDAESIAAYAQATLSLSEALSLTTGIRYTRDEKTASRSGLESPGVDSDNWDYLIALDYDITDNIGSYIKLSSAYKEGGYNSRSATFLSFDEEQNRSLELGFKTEWLNNRIRTNAAIFSSEIRDKQFDFVNPFDPRFADTFNAKQEVDFSGVELEISAMPLDNFMVSLNYTYLDGDMPLQPHPLTGEQTRFELINVPPHAGSIALDYTLPRLSFGSIHAHVDISSTDHYSYTTQVNSRTDAYTLVNARISIEEISFTANGNLSLSIWGRNLTDEPRNRSWITQVCTSY